jgi:hypothetical protein
MPVIEPIPMDELPPVSRTLIEGGCEEGLYATPIPLQLFAYSTRQLMSMDDHRRMRGAGSLLGGRILELLRIRSAQLGECQPCMQSRKHDSITDEDVACLLDVDGSDLTDQERLAVKFMDLLSADHHAIDREFYAELAKPIRRWSPTHPTRSTPRSSPSASPDGGLGRLLTVGQGSANVRPSGSRCAGERR